jgi:Clp amino terminal domain, pathogenicity island component
LTLAQRQLNLDAMEGGRLPTLDELAAVVEARAGEPAARLGAAIELGRELTDLGDALIGRFVADARAAGLSWTEIGRLFGTSKQAVQQRYGTTTFAGGDWPGRWTPDVRRALDSAGQEARVLSHDYVGTEHVLLAVASAEGGVAAAVLRELGVARDRILATSCMRPGPSSRSPRECLPLMPRLKQALEHSRRIADGLDARLADNEHLLAGIVAVPDSMAVEILRRLGVKAADVQAALAERMGVAPQLLGAVRRRRRRLLAPSR